jgi:hypothetical protein
VRSSGWCWTCTRARVPSQNVDTEKTWRTFFGIDAPHHHLRSALCKSTSQIAHSDVAVARLGSPLAESRFSGTGKKVDQQNLWIWQDVLSLARYVVNLGFRDNVQGMLGTAIAPLWCARLDGPHVACAHGMDVRAVMRQTATCAASHTARRHILCAGGLASLGNNGRGLVLMLASSETATSNPCHDALMMP